jgi:hypothetical protein
MTALESLRWRGGRISSFVGRAFSCLAARGPETAGTAGIPPSNNAAIVVNATCFFASLLFTMRSTLRISCPSRKEGSSPNHRNLFRIVGPLRQCVSGREVAAPYIRTLELSNWLVADARGFVPWGVAHNLQGARHLDARIRGQVLDRLVVGTVAAHARDVRSRSLSIDEPCELTMLQTHRRGPPKRPLPSCGRRRGRHEPKQPRRPARYWRVRSEAAPEPYEGPTFVRRTYRPWTGRPYPGEGS